jgi:hypothetical protein
LTLQVCGHTLLLMNDWEDPVQRAAVWYVAVFGATAVLVLTGANLTNFDWTSAAHPLAAVAVIAVALGCAVLIVALAARVLLPRFTLNSLIERQRKAEKLEAGAKAWQNVAKHDDVLAPLVSKDFFLDEAYAPISARAVAFDTGAPAADREAAKRRCLDLVEAANRRYARTAFTLLRWVTPAASLIVVACVLTWGTVSRTRNDDTASTSNPIPVSVHLAPAANAGIVIGKGCTATTYQGVALAGNIDESPLVALDPQGTCPATFITVTPDIGKAVRLK